MKYGVSITVRTRLDQIEVEAENEDEARKIACEEYESLPMAFLDSGFSAIDCEVEPLE